MVPCGIIGRRRGSSREELDERIERMLDELGWKPARVVIADRLPKRLLGMIAVGPERAAASPAPVYVFPRCRAVHTCFMRYPLDIAFASRGGGIARRVEGVEPWRFLSCPNADAVLERSAVVARISG